MRVVWRWFRCLKLNAHKTINTILIIKVSNNGSDHTLERNNFKPKVPREDGQLSNIALRSLSGDAFLVGKSCLSAILRLFSGSVCLESFDGPVDG